MPKKHAAASHSLEEEEQKEPEDELMNGDANDDAVEGEDDNDDDDGDMEEEDGDDGDDDEIKENPEDGEEDEEKKNGSPSPVARRDMHLRSGKRKRARSKNTSGLTPPEKQSKPRASKRSRTDATPATPAVDVSKTSTILLPEQQEQDQQDPSPSSQATTNGVIVNDTKGATPSSDASPAGVPDPRRISYAASVSRQASSTMTHHIAPAAPTDQDDDVIVDAEPPPEISAVASTGSKTEGENGMAAESYTTTTTVKTTQTVKVTVDAAFAVGGADTTLTDNEVLLDIVETVEEDFPQQMGRLRILVRLGFLVVLSLLFSVVWPQVVKLADILVPLNASILLPPLPEMPVADMDDGETAEDVIIVEEVEPPAHEIEAWNTEFLEKLKTFNNLEQVYRKSSRAFPKTVNHIHESIRKLQTQFQARDETLQGKLHDLAEMESFLSGSGGDDDGNDEQWYRMQSALQQVVGKTLLKTSSISLWNVIDLTEEVCDQGDDEAIILDEDIDAAETAHLLTPQLLREKEADLLLRAQMSAEKFMTGDAAKDRIRRWVRPLINKALSSNMDAAEAIARIPELARSANEMPSEVASHPPGENAAEAIQEIVHTINDRLEMDRADATGVYDHAALKNGAEIIYGGKRGTSKSLIDYLPLYNRLLQKANIRFYGFGPEAALTPTHPPNTLGQCWSFHPSTLKEQLNDRQLYQSENGVPNDFKRGNFGTLTIRLPTPVYVTSVVIEHIPRRLTDRADSAIRSFRVFGYQDSAAATKAWNLGAFEYSIQKNDKHEYLQEFDVATSVFGSEIPALQSISLAVDANWGHDYSCLYRFRVHGEEAVES